jgi:hypothetical protein
MKKYMMTTPTETQLRVAQRVANKIKIEEPKAEVEIKINGALVFVSSLNTYKWWLLEIGVRGGIVNCHTKKSVRYVDNAFKFC